MSEEGGGAVDFGYLERFAAGDQAVIREVLELFRSSAAEWSPKLVAQAPDWPETVHTIKGAGRGIGAMGLGDVCAKAEADGEALLPKVREALAAAVAEIERYLAAD